MSGWRMH